MWRSPFQLIDLQHISDEEMRAKTKTLAEQFREEGLQKGRNETARTIALAMLQKGMSVELIVELTGFDVSQEIF